MKHARACLAGILSLLVTMTAPVGAVSLYTGGRVTQPTEALPMQPTAPLAAAPVIAPLASAELPAAQVLPEAAPEAASASPISQAQAAAAASAGPQAARSLDELFDAHVQESVDAYFGSLSAGEEPGVVVSRRARVQDAPGDGDLVDAVKEAKLTVAEREAAAIKLFVQGGAKYDPARAKVAVPDFTRYDEVQLQEVLDGRGRPTGKHNIFVFKKGKDEGRVLVNSSHNDKVDVEGDEGVIDNWTGTALATLLYRAEKGLETQASRLYVTFAREEEGLLGSQFFLDSLSAEQRAKLEGNINYDTIAIKGGETNSWENNSDAPVLDAMDAAVAAANRERPADAQLQLKRAYLDGGDADSSSFRWKKILATTIFSGPPDLVFSIIHTSNDNFGAFDSLMFKNTFLVALAILRWVDAHPLSSPRVA